MTVSNVVNGHPSVGTELRRRVKKQIERLNYQPDLRARSFRLARGWAIGMLVVLDSPDFLGNPWVGNVVAGLSRYLGENNYGLYLNGCSRSELGSKIRPFENTDALCVFLSGSTTERRELLKRICEFHKPVVALQETVVPPTDGAIVRQDDRAGGRLIAEHLRERGVKRVAMIAPSVPWPAIKEREIGVREVFRKCPGAQLRMIYCGAMSIQDVRAAVEADLKQRALPEAFITTSDQIALPTLGVLAQHGIRSPQDVLVTGFNAFEFWRYSAPVLTSIETPPLEIGRVAGELLLDRLTRGEFRVPSVTLPVKLVQGDSA
jgi:LacI family transcriptional regulator